MPGHRATPWGWASAKGQILSGAWLGVLTRVVPPGLVEEAAGDGLAWEMRLRSPPAPAALTAARRRLGEKPLESLFRRLCSPLSPGTQPWSHVRGLLAVAWDGPASPWSIPRRTRRRSGGRGPPG